MLVFALLLALPLAIQARTTGPASDDEPAPAIRGCSRSPDTITVCGNGDPSRFRAPPLPQRYAEKPLRPQFALPGGGTGRVEATQRSAGGVSVPAALVTLKIPLGGPKKK